MSLKSSLQQIARGEVIDDPKILVNYSHDTSIFERTPKVAVFPKDSDDVAAVIKYVHDAKARGEDVSIAARAAGTDMSGGPLTDSIALVFTKHMNHIGPVTPDEATTEPGVYYRDFEKQTLAKAGKLLPSYPASRNIAAMGGIVANNSAGELTLKYGKTSKYVRSLDVVLSDGSRTTFKPITFDELEKKKALDTLEGKIYRDIHNLIVSNRAVIEGARPTVSKNSSGYALWDVMDEKNRTFDLTKLITGSQGTLAIWTSATLDLVKLKAHRAMLVVFLSDFGILPEVVHRVLKYSPESFESYDDQTFKLAVRYIPQIIGQLGFMQMIKLGFAFIPEMWMAITGGVPKLILIAEFAEDTPEEALKKALSAQASLEGLPLKTHIARTESEAAKYWTIRRESFSLLRKNLSGLYASPFIDDFVVHPDDYPGFLPELNALLAKYHLLYTIAGHIGQGNFHIIPLMDLSNEDQRKAVLELSPQVYDLVIKYRGSITGEHNDGIIRTPYVHRMFGDEMYHIFEQVKHIFDPLNILNPGKKVGGTVDDITRSMITHH